MVYILNRIEESAIHSYFFLYNRMSLDLATSSSFPSNGGDKSLLLVSSGSGSVSGNGESKVESLDAVKPFGHPGDDIGPRPLKRVQSSAVLSAIEEVQNIVSESSQEEVSPEGIEEVLKRLSDHVISNCTFADEEAAKQVKDLHFVSLVVYLAKGGF